MRTLVSRIAFHMKRARRASICSPMSGDIGVDAGDPAQHGREQELGDGRPRCPLNARPNSFCCFTWINGVDLGYGSTADQGRTGREDSSSRLWRPARALGTHAKRGPSTGHSAVGLRQGGKCLLTPRPHFTAPSCTLGNQVVRASDGPPFRQERRPTRVGELPGPVAVCSPKQAHCELGDRVAWWRPHR